MANFDYTQSRETDPGFEAPRPNLGPGHALEQAFKVGWAENMTTQSVRASKYLGIRIGAAIADRDNRRRVG